MKSDVILSDVLTHFIDEIATYLTGDETKLFLYIARMAFDGDTYLATLTPKQMMDATGLDGQRALTALTALIQYNVINERNMTPDGTEYGVNASPDMEGLRAR